MKTLLLVVMPFLSLGQDLDSVYNFSFGNSDVSWQKIYDVTVSPHDYLMFIKSKGICDMAEINDVVITGSFQNVSLNISGANVKKGRLPFDFDFSISGGMRIEFKENRYRVTLTNIRLNHVSDGVFSKSGESETLYEYAHHGKKISPMFKKNTGKVIDYSLISAFEYKPQSEDNW